jgi:hypothetical protein
MKPQHRAGAIIPRVRSLVVSVALLAACSQGGQYTTGMRQPGDADRGETNGRQFDFVSNLPDGEDWQIRIRGNSLWAAYSEGKDVNELGTVPISKKDATRLWDLVDELEIPDRDKGKQDADEGWVQLRLREPDDEQHDLFTVYISRADAEDDDEVLAVAEDLQKLVQKYFKRKPTF